MPAAPERVQNGISWTNLSQQSDPLISLVETAASETACCHLMSLSWWRYGWRAGSPLLSQVSNVCRCFVLLRISFFSPATLVKFVGYIKENTGRSQRKWLFWTYFTLEAGRDASRQFIPWTFQQQQKKASPLLLCWWNTDLSKTVPILCNIVVHLYLYSNNNTWFTCD